MNNTVDWMIYEQIYLTFLEAAKSKVRVPTDWVSGESVLPSSQTDVFALCSPVAKGQGALQISIIRVQSPLMRTLPSLPHYFPKTSPLHTTILRE